MSKSKFTRRLDVPKDIQLSTTCASTNDSSPYGEEKNNDLAPEKLLNEEQETQEIATAEQEVTQTTKIIYINFIILPVKSYFDDNHR